MNKVIAVIVLTLLFGAQHALAQSVYPTSYPTNYQTPTPSYQQPYNSMYSGSCSTIVRDVSIGSRGPDVLQLQQFILTRNYPGSGSWMLTSYFGTATRAGVVDFQIDMHLPQTGILDAQTRGALSQVTCGYNNIAPIPNIAPAPYPYNNNSYPYNYGNQYGSQYPSTITQPWYNYGSYTYGNGYNGNCSSVYGSSSCQCGYAATAYNYNNCGTTSSNSNSPTLTYLSPNTGAVGSAVTVYGSNFSTTGNSVHFGNGVIAGLNSYDGRSVSFTVPSTLSGYGYSQVTPGVYNISVTDNSGFTSNVMQYTVNSVGIGNNYNAPTISNVSGPNTINVNTTGTWIISINNQNNQYGSNYTSVSVNWGDPVYGAYLAAPQQVYGAQSATFTHAYSQTGTYTITFTVSNGYGSNTSTITVQVNNSNNNSGNGTPSISYITPTSGSIGTQITIYGTGFSGDNTVHFGSGGIAHVTSASGNYIYFTVPSSLTPCTVQTNGNTGCPQYAQQVTPGQYSVYVTTNGLNSNSLTFTVQ